jgi:hypothetical protein
MIRSPALAAHELPAEEWLAAPLGSPGAVLGAERPGTLVTVRLFRPRPATIGVFAGPAVSRLLVVRAMTMGAGVYVLTPHPARWAALRDQMPEARFLLTLLPADAAVPASASLPVPALVVDEIDPGTPAPRRALGPWQTSLVVQPHLSPQALGTLRTFDGLVMQRVPEPAAEPIRTGLALPARQARWLPQMPDDVVAVIAGTDVRFATLTPLPTEPPWLAAEPPTPGHPPRGPAPGGQATANPAPPGPADAPTRPGPDQPQDPLGQQPQPPPVP